MLPISLRRLDFGVQVSAIGTPAEPAAVAAPARGTKRQAIEAVSAPAKWADGRRA